MLFPMRRSTPGVKNKLVWKSPRLVVSNALNKKNAQLKKLLAESLLDNEALKVAKVLTVRNKREAVRYMLSQTAISERRACSLVGLNHATMRYQSQSRQETDLVQRIKAIAFERRRFGDRRVHQLLRRERRHVNHKKVYRLYREARLAARKRKRRKGLMVERQPLLPDRPNHIPGRRILLWTHSLMVGASNA